MNDAWSEVVKSTVRQTVLASWWAGLADEANNSHCEVHECKRYGTDVTILGEFPARLCMHHRRMWWAACHPLHLQIEKHSYHIRLIEWAVGAGTMARIDGAAALMRELDAREVLYVEARALFHAALRAPTAHPATDEAGVSGIDSAPSVDRDSGDLDDGC